MAVAKKKVLNIGSIKNKSKIINGMQAQNTGSTRLILMTQLKISVCSSESYLDKR